MTAVSSLSLARVTKSLLLAISVCCLIRTQFSPLSYCIEPLTRKRSDAGSSNGCTSRLWLQKERKRAEPTGPRKAKGEERERSHSW